ncbi:helix-turn-helix domain-containing protein [Agrobacterium vitis]
MDRNGVYIGPRLRRLRRDLGLTQVHMASDLEISPSYIALMERNQRPVTAEMLLRLAKTYKIDFSELSDGSGRDTVARLQSVVRDPILSDVDFDALEIGDVASSFPGFAEALLRLHLAYKEAQFALADVNERSSSDASDGTNDPVAAVRSFLSTRRNCFPVLDTAAEKLAVKVGETGGLVCYLKQHHNLRVRRMPSSVMAGSLRRLDWHRKEILLSDTLDGASQNFQLAQQLAYLEFEEDINLALAEGQFPNENSLRLGHRALAAYCAAALLMPYATFARAAETRGYDIESIARQFGTSFEQTAHRMTTLQKPGQEHVPFFFIRVDAAGNVSKRLNSGTFPFARHGGGCPLWSVYQVFSAPRRVVTQWLELPDGQRFFSIARTVSSGGGAYGQPHVERAVALVCEANHADRLVYNRNRSSNEIPTPIGIGCRLCHRIECPARSEPPIGRQILADTFRRMDAPFGFSDA